MEARMSQYILALDQGTTSSRSLVFDHAGHIVALAQKEFTQHYPQPGWVEHDPEEILATQLATARDAVAQAGLTMADIAGIGITNQRETTAVVWDRATGKAIHNAIVWQDRRTAETIATGCAAKSGACRRHPPDAPDSEMDAYFSGTKARLDPGPCRWRPGTGPSAASWPWARSTAGSSGTSPAGAVHATDPSNASRTLLYNLHDLAWDPAMLDLLRGACRHAARGPAEQRRLRDGHGPFRRGRPSGSQGWPATNSRPCSASSAHAPGMVKNTYGTGCFMLMNTGTEAVMSQTPFAH